MTFRSILFERTEDTKETPEAPDFFVDLNLDQMINAITKGRQEYNLKPFFYTPLYDSDAITYRHEVMRDLENDTLLERIELFAKRMRTMRKYLAQAKKLYYTYQKERWFLDAVELYCTTVTNLLNDLSLADLHSRGFLAFRDYVRDYAHSSRFTQLVAETKQLKAELSAIMYCLRIKGNSITVRAYEGEIDSSADVAETFEKFRQGAVQDYHVKFPDWPEMNHVEAHILELVARLNPNVFFHLNEYCTNQKDYLDETIATFDREIQFYLAYLEYCARIKQAGLPFCFPRISPSSKEVHAYEAFDAALASKLVREGASVVCNDFHVQGKERVLVVSGPNQGGKSTFLRSVGLAQVMMQCGMFVPAESFCANICTGLFTHYKRKEDTTMKSGKLDEELSRMSQIVDMITPDCLLLLNESFAATNEREGSEIARQIITALLEKRIKVFFVTHLYIFAHRFSEKQMANALFLRADRQADGRRTFKLIEGEPLQTSYGEDVYQRVFGL